MGTWMLDFMKVGGIETSRVGQLKADAYNLRIFMVVSRWILLRMRNVSDKSCREDQNTHFIFNTFSKNCTIYKTVWKIW